MIVKNGNVIMERWKNYIGELLEKGNEGESIQRKETKYDKDDKVQKEGIVQNQVTVEMLNNLGKEGIA